ncbi:MAG: histidine kinase dimerization/phosphoacceptor domain-containing protein [Candidatus Solibacter usitatus]|nr:histidine kinase dimerization/phosphoacceptor domain-containing protein [Candidatus Solibacter usitatus]
MESEARTHAAGAAEGQQALRRIERQRVSRILHDEVGPSLCSAGLMLGLVEAAGAALDAESRGLLDSIRSALESTVDSVRRLSYQSDPDIAARCGLESALHFLAAGENATISFPAGPAGLPAAQAEMLCLTVRDLLLAWPGRALRLEVTPSGLLLTAPPDCRLPAAPRLALEQAAAGAGLVFSCSESAEATTVSLTTGRAN